LYPFLTEKKLSKYYEKTTNRLVFYHHNMKKKKLQKKDQNFEKINEGRKAQKLEMIHA